MGDSFTISRGNPGSSASEDNDIKRIGLQSPSTLTPQLVVEITDCAEEGGVSGVDPCSQLTLEIYNVMGQEDKFRRENEQRVDNGGQARIVVTTTANATLDIDYASNPADEDNPTLGQTWEDVSTEEKYHEIFVPVNPDSLYAFRVKAQSDDCPDITDESDIYYFQTGTDIFLPGCFGITLSVSFEIVDTIINKTQTAPTCEVESKTGPDKICRPFSPDNTFAVHPTTEIAGTVDNTTTSYINPTVVIT